MPVKNTNERSTAFFLAALVLALATPGFAQSNRSSTSGGSPYFERRSESSFARLVQTESQDPPTQPPAPLEDPEEPVDVEPPTFDSPFLTSQRPVRISSVPDMFGDFFGGGGQLLVRQENLASRQQFNLLSDLPLAGGSRRVKVAENNKALTDDRVYLLYNHFHNALQARSGAPPGAMGTGPIVSPYNVNRYTFGFEKSFLNGLVSTEFRLPLNGIFRFGSSSQLGNSAANFNVQGGRVGNLAVLLKGQLLATGGSAVAFGCGIDLPTGSDVHARTIFTRGETSGPVAKDDLSLVIKNEALHLLPFFAVSHAPTNNLFCHLFVQADLAANSNPVDVSFVGQRPGAPDMELQRRIGNYTEQNLLFVDCSAGCWLYRQPSARVVRGLAALLELHYTTSIQDTDNVQALLSPFPPPTKVRVTNLRNRFDVLNVTAGVHFRLAGNSSLRIAGVVPMRQAYGQRFFDSEAWASFIKQL